MVTGGVGVGLSGMYGVGTVGIVGDGKLVIVQEMFGGVGWSKHVGNL